MLRGRIVKDALNTSRLTIVNASDSATAETVRTACIHMQVGMLGASSVVDGSAPSAPRVTSGTLERCIVPPLTGHGHFSLHTHSSLTTSRIQTRKYASDASPVEPPPESESDKAASIAAERHAKQQKLYAYLREVNSLARNAMQAEFYASNLNVAPRWETDDRSELPELLWKYHQEMRESRADLEAPEGSTAPRLPFLNQAVHTVIAEEKQRTEGQLGSASYPAPETAQMMHTESMGTAAVYSRQQQQQQPAMDPNQQRIVLDHTAPRPPVHFHSHPLLDTSSPIAPLSASIEDRNTAAENALPLSAEVQQQEEASRSFIGHGELHHHHSDEVGQVCSALVPMLPLGKAQWYAIAEAMRIAIPGSQPVGATDIAVVPTLVITPESAQKMAAFLLHACSLSEGEVLKIIASHAWLLGVDPSIYCMPVMEFLHLLDLRPREIAGIVSSFPRALVADVDKHLMPLAAYLEDLGLRERQAAEFIIKHPPVLRTAAYHELTSSVAFWTGRGLNKAQISRLLGKEPKVIDTSQQLVQLKMDWLKDRVGFTTEDFAALPQAFVLPLASLIGPRVAFAQQEGFQVLPPSQSHLLLASLKPDSGMNTCVTMNALVSKESYYLKIVKADKHKFDAYAQQWRQGDFSDWLAARGKPELEHYQAMDWLEADQSAAMRQRHMKHAAMRQEAWSQQKTREREWRAAWKAWKLERMLFEKERDLLEQAEKRREEKRLHEEQFQDFLSLAVEKMNDEDRRGVQCAINSDCEKIHGHRGRCKTRKPEEAQSSRPKCNRHYWCVAEKRHKGACTAEGMPDHAILNIKLDQLTPSLVKECAENMMNELKAADSGAVSRILLYQVLKDRGYSSDCITLAKGYLVASGVAELETRAHYKTKIAWKLSEPSQQSSEEEDVVLQDDVADNNSILVKKKSRTTQALTVMEQLLGDAPGQAIAVEELKERTQMLLTDDFDQKAFTRALYLLKEECRVVCQDHYLAGTPKPVKELRLVNLSDIDEFFAQEEARTKAERDQWPDLNKEIDIQPANAQTNDDKIIHESVEEPQIVNDNIRLNMLDTIYRMMRRVS